MIIFFAGNGLDWLGSYRPADPLTTSPIAIRGYDSAGNLLCAIRYGTLPNTTLLFNNEETGENSYSWSGYTKYGVPITITTNNILYSTKDRYYPKDIAICPVTNHIFCVTNTFSEYINGAYIDVMFDFSKVFNRDGYEVPFPQLHGLAIYAIEIDASGNIFVGGEGYYDSGTEKYYALRKYDSTGSLVWSADTTLAGYDHYITSITLDSGNIYTVGTTNVTGYKGEIRKYNSSGVLVWRSALYSPQLADVAYGKLVIYSGYVYVGGSGYIYKLDDSDGSEVDHISDPGKGYLTFSNEQLHVVSFAPFAYTYYKVYDTNLVQVGDTISTSRYAFRHPIAIDENGTRYFGGNRTITDETYLLSTYYNLWHFAALDDDDADPWDGLTATMARGISWQTGELRTDPVYAALEYETAWGGTAGPDQGLNSIGGNVDFWGRTTCIKILADSMMPALPIPLSFGTPSWQGDRYTNSPALALALRLGLPLNRRDYVGRPLPMVYRAYLTGTTDLELPISSLQCRRDAAGTSLALIIPALDSATIAAIEARETGDVVVRRGFRFADGTEQIDEMFRMPLTGLRYDFGSQSGSASLTAAAVNPVGGYARTLTGISYRNTIAANRRIRCAVDTYLLPGDIANLGNGETLTVAEIVYSIGPDSATMEVAE